MYAAFFVSGLAAILYEIAWQRVLTTLYGSDLPSVTIAVASFMLGLGIGSLLGGALTRNDRWRLSAVFASLEIGTAVCGAASLPLMHWMARQTASVPIGGLMLTTSAMLIVPTTLMGATLPVMVAIDTRRSRSVGPAVSALYGLNTLGGATGAVIAAAVVLPALGLHDSVHVAALLNLAVAALILARRNHPA